MTSKAPPYEPIPAPRSLRERMDDRILARQRQLAIDAQECASVLLTLSDAELLARIQPIFLDVLDKLAELTMRAILRNEIGRLDNLLRMDYNTTGGSGAHENEEAHRRGLKLPWDELKIREELEFKYLLKEYERSPLIRDRNEDHRP